MAGRAEKTLAEGHLLHRAYGRRQADPSALSYGHRIRKNLYYGGDDPVLL